MCRIITRTIKKNKISLQELNQIEIGTQDFSWIFVIFSSASILCIYKDPLKDYIYLALVFCQSVWMRQVYKDFKAPYVGIWLFWRPGLVVNSPELTRRILVKDSENFRNHFLSSGKTDPIGSLNLFTINVSIAFESFSRI